MSIIGCCFCDAISSSDDGGVAVNKRTCSTRSSVFSDNVISMRRAHAALWLSMVFKESRAWLGKKTLLKRVRNFFTRNEEVNYLCCLPRFITTEVIRRGAFGCIKKMESAFSKTTQKTWYYKLKIYCNFCLQQKIKENRKQNRKSTVLGDHCDKIEKMAKDFHRWG